MLAGLFDCYGYVPAEPEASARLALYPEKQWLRVVAHHCDGPEGKWVEVQIRTRRMDEIAERGLAAHWRYKGIKGETGLDEWLTSVREALENADNDR